MSLTVENVKKIAHLARLNFSEQELALYTPQLSRILDFVEQMNQIETSHIEPMAHPLDLSQPLREDKVTEVDQHKLFQATAPKVEADLYLVPKVIE